MPAYLILALAVLAETIGTTALQASQQFTRLWPSILVVLAYAVSFYLLSMTLKVMPVGVVYALWSGLGIILIAIIGFAVFGQRLDLPAVLGLALIICGIAVIHLFSDATPH
ncbi:SMR family transporter [Sulfitobacter sp. SK011]|uniref:SMR family transporter n=1 Tax=Sulfitobacter sp. SK011 TaxID=1389004 RepID=UPI000E0BB579|nr:SMR family transporter [Sulfitobacter sp. SK011]AXI42421.1 QacE family quaternary ammonium compound efflux SMR transporter [Sulfitobacter sp. SK011]